MDLKRLAHHLWMTPWHLEKAFPDASLAAIEAAIAESEAAHGAEIRFAVEGALPTGNLLRGETARERAIELFARLGIWDTEENCGVLIYLLLADRDVEIVADRGVHAKVGEEEWESICRRMESAFRKGHYQAGVLSGIEAVTRLLVQHYPLRRERHDELPDRPLRL